MLKTNPQSTPSELHDVISAFLASPPAGTPMGIIEAFDVPGTKEFLPPKLFLETVEQAPVAISITDPEARILYANSAFEKLTGYQRDEVVGQKESMLSSKSTPQRVYQQLWETIQEKRVWQGTLVNRRKNGEDYLAEISISPVLNIDGEISYYLGMHRDITQLHKLEKRLKFQQKLTEVTLEVAPVVVAMISSDRKILLDNHAYKALLGDLRGAEPAELFLDALEQQIKLDIRQVCNAGKGFSNVEIRLDPPGSGAPRWFSCSGVRVEELTETVNNYFEQAEKVRCCLLLIANEVTESRHRINEARLNMIRANMAEQQMVQTMREAISGSIFKLQEPLNVIKAALAMPDTGAEPGGLRTVLQQALGRGDDAVTSLQAAVPTASVEDASRVNINEILHEVLSLSTAVLLASGVVVDWRPEAVLPPVVGRANALRGVFKYLIDNAIQAMNESSQNYRELRLRTRLDHDELVVEITDSGGGIADNLRLRVFEPFFCGWKQSRGHSGMGLTMAQEVMIGHDGSVEIDDDFLGGCRVLVRLPVDEIEEYET